MGLRVQVVRGFACDRDTAGLRWVLELPVTASSGCKTPTFRLETLDLAYLHERRSSPPREDDGIGRWKEMRAEGFEPPRA